MWRTPNLTVTSLATPVMGQTDIMCLSDVKHHGLSIFCIKEGAFSSATFVIWALVGLWATIFPNWARWLFCFVALLLDVWSFVNFSLLTILTRPFLHIRFSLRPAALCQSPGTSCNAVTGSSLISPAGPSAFSSWFALKGLQCLKGIFHLCLPSQRLVALDLLKICYGLGANSLISPALSLAFRWLLPDPTHLVDHLSRLSRLALLLSI